MLPGDSTRLKDRELSSTLQAWLPLGESKLWRISGEGAGDSKELAGKKTKTPIEAYRYIEKIRWKCSLPAGGIQQLGLSPN